MTIAIRQLEEGLLFDCSRTFYPSRMYGHTRGESVFDEVSSYYYGFVVSGEVALKTENHSEPFLIGPGCYFGLNGKIKLSGDGQTAVIERIGYRGLSTIGGPVEKNGRLLYIDNCRSTLLIPPARLGDPCFNLLTFPTQTRQTSHIHPTIRLGIVSSGRGKCVIPNAEPKPLKAGLVFFIEDGSPHCFHTEQETMAVIAYHPDGDWGPTDENHPMYNRTFRR